MNETESTLTILYRDEHLVVIDKPAGLLVHKSPVDRHETQYAMKRLRDQLGQWVYPVHRLDKPTSGVLVFGLNSRSARQLADQFEAREARKGYCAVVRGWPPLGGIIAHPIREMTMFKNAEGKFEKLEPKPSLTLYHRLGVAEIDAAVDRYPRSRYSLVACYPKTGRQHQIRRHLKHIAHPIIGDVRYGKGKHNQFFSRHYGIDRLMLHAFRLGFRHPVTAQWMEVSAPMPAEFLRLSSVFGWDDRRFQHRPGSAR